MVIEKQYLFIVIDYQLKNTSIVFDLGNATGDLVIAGAQVEDPVPPKVQGAEPARLDSCESPPVETLPEPNSGTPSGEALEASSGSLVGDRPSSAVSRALPCAFSGPDRYLGGARCAAGSSRNPRRASAGLKTASRTPQESRPARGALAVSARGDGGCFNEISIGASNGGDGVRVPQGSSPGFLTPVRDPSGGLSRSPFLGTPQGLDFSAPPSGARPAAPAPAQPPVVSPLPPPLGGLGDGVPVSSPFAGMPKAEPERPPAEAGADSLPPATEPQPKPDVSFAATVLDTVLDAETAEEAGRCSVESCTLDAQGDALMDAGPGK